MNGSEEASLTETMKHYCPAVTVCSQSSPDETGE